MQSSQRPLGEGFEVNDLATYHMDMMTNYWVYIIIFLVFCEVSQFIGVLPRMYVRACSCMYVHVRACVTFTVKLGLPCSRVYPSVSNATAVFVL